MKRLLTILIVLAIILTAAGPVRADSVSGFQYHGYITQDGSPVTGECDFDFSLYDASTDGNHVGTTQTHDNVTVTSGWFWVTLNFGSVFDGTGLWLETSATCDADPKAPLSPRQELGATPYALNALTSPWSGLTGVPAGFADGTDDVGTYTNGSGLSLTGNQFAVDFGVAQVRVTGSCSAGNLMTGVNQDGSVNCGSDSNTTYSDGSGLSLSGTVFSVDYSEVQARISSSCASGYVMTGVNASGVPTCTVDLGGAHDINGAQHTGTPLGVTKGGTGTTTQMTAGSVLFAGTSGVYSQDNANLFWDDVNNRLGIGTTVPASGFIIDAVGGSIRVMGNSGYLGFESRLFSSSTHPAFILSRGRGTMASPSGVQSNDALGAFVFNGYTSSGAIKPVADIIARAKQNFTTTALGTSIEFYVTKLNTASEFLAMSVLDTGVAWFEKGAISKNTVQATGFTIGNSSGTLTATGLSTTVTTIYDVRIGTSGSHQCRYITQTFTGGILTAVSTPTDWAYCTLYME